MLERPATPKLGNMRSRDFSMHTLRMILWIGLALLAPATRATDFAVYVRDLREEGSHRTTAPASLPLPAYPADFIRAGVTGYATVRFRIGTDGAVAEAATVEASQKEFSEAANAAIAHWKFSRVPDSKTDATNATWMQCTVVFRVNEEPDYLPTFAPGFATTHLSGHDVLELAVAQAKKDGVDVNQFTKYGVADIFLSESGHQFRWGVTWHGAEPSAGYYRVWINDTTRETSSERKKPAPVAPTPAR